MGACHRSMRYQMVQRIEDEGFALISCADAGQSLCWPTHGYSLEPIPGHACDRWTPSSRCSITHQQGTPRLLLPGTTSPKKAFVQVGPVHC